MKKREKHRKIDRKKGCFITPFFLQKIEKYLKNIKNKTLQEDKPIYN